MIFSLTAEQKCAAAAVTAGCAADLPTASGEDEDQLATAQSPDEDEGELLTTQHRQLSAATAQSPDEDEGELLPAQHRIKGCYTGIIVHIQFACVV